MHALPPGETPGWTAPFWFNFEASHSGHWNIPTNMTDLRTNSAYKYKAIFEQSSAIAEIGFAPLESLGLAIEIPYAYRSGGFMSDFVKQFHWAVGSNTYQRPSHPGYQNHLGIQKDGIEQLDSNRGEGVGSLKFKMKWWMWQWKGDDRGSCDCGLAVSAQVKAPMKAAATGMSSGSTDLSGLVHFGVPLFEESGAWFTGSLTRLGENENFRGWPMRRWSQSYELSTDWAIDDTWGIILQGRITSPLFNVQYLRFNDPGVTDPQQFANDREASGWNSMVHWVGSETIGLRYRFGEGQQISFLFLEDWAFGNQDGRAEWVYTHGAPDFSFILQMHFVL